MYILPAGALGSVATWWSTRRKRDNDFIADLQDSINLLAETNKTLLAELVEVKKQNAQLVVNQEKMKNEIGLLRDENKSLREMVSDLNEKLENVKTITRTK